MSGSSAMNVVNDFLHFTLCLKSELVSRASYADTGIARRVCGFAVARPSRAGSSRPALRRGAPSGR